MEMDAAQTSLLELPPARSRQPSTCSRHSHNSALSAVSSLLAARKVSFFHRAAALKVVLARLEICVISKLGVAPV